MVALLFSAPSPDWSTTRTLGCSPIRARDRLAAATSRRRSTLIDAPTGTLAILARAPRGRPICAAGAPRRWPRNPGAPCHRNTSAFRCTPQSAHHPMCEALGLALRVDYTAEIAHIALRLQGLPVHCECRRETQRQQTKESQQLVHAVQFQSTTQQARSSRPILNPSRLPSTVSAICF